MIPEFITAKPSTNRNATDAPSVPDPNSADQTKNRAAFQKALHERTSERPAEQQDSTANKIQPEESHQSTPPRASNETSHADVSQDTSGAAENQESRSTPDSANSTASNASRTDVNREPEVRGQNDGTEASPGNPERSKQIRRIDPANHSTSNDTATGSPEKAVESGEVSKPASEAVLPGFASTDDSDVGTLPSLIRIPLDGVTIRQSSGDFISPDATSDGASIGVSVPSDSSGQNVSGADSELRPFLNDALIPDAESVAVDARFTTTESALIAGDLLSSPVVGNEVSPIAGEELLAIPTLPSLQPEVTSTLLSSSPVESDGKDVGTPVIENVAGDVVANGILRSAEPSSAATPTDLEPSAQSPTDGVVTVDDSPSEELPLVLPSLVSGPKRTTEAASKSENHNLSGEQTSTRETPTQSSPAAAAPAVSESSLQISAPPQVEAVPLAQQKVVAEKPQVVESASTFSGDSATGPSKNSAPQSPAVVSPVESSGREPASYVSRRTTENSDPSTIVENTAASSSGDIDSEQPTPRPKVAELDVPERTVPTVSDQVDSSQPAEVESALAATPPEEAVNVQNRTRESIVSAESSIARQPAQRASTAEDQQTVQNLAASVAVANPEVVDAVQIESSDDPASERASIRTAGVNEPNSRKRNIDASPHQKSADSTGSAQTNPERPIGSGRSVVETPPPQIHQDSGARSQGSVPIIAPGDELAAGAQAGPPATTTVERVGGEPRTGNDFEASTVNNAGATSAPQARQPVTSVAVQSGPVSDVPTSAVGASPSSINEIGNVSAPAAPVEVQASDVTTIPNAQAAATTTNAATSNAATRPDVVREPAVPMEIQDAVSAIQEATSGDSHIRVRLNPRELGNMLVDVSRTENGVVARLEVESAAARVAVLETLPDLQQSLSRSGSTVDRVEVVLTETRAESGRQESDQSQPREQPSRQERQSSNQQARDERNEQNQRRDQREHSDSVEEDSTENKTPEQLDIKL